MNPEPPAKPLEHLLRDTLHEAESMARREPAKAVAAAFGIGLLFHVLPKRLIVSTATTAALTLLKPALLTFGIVKAAELVLTPSPSQSHSQTSHE
jgi:hypothetical protein